MEIKYCESCGNYVPTVQVDEDIYCSYEYAEYPDIATVVGQLDTPHMGPVYKLCTIGAPLWITMWIVVHLKLT